MENSKDILSFRTKDDFSEISTHLSNLLSNPIELEKFSVTKFYKSKHTWNKEHNHGNDCGINQFIRLIMKEYQRRYLDKKAGLTI